VTIGILADCNVTRSFKFDTGLLKNKRNTVLAIKERLKDLFPLQEEIEGVYVSSVVPSFNKNIRGILKDVFGLSAVVIGEDAHVPIINRYRIPSQVGQDRLVNAYAGMKLHGSGLIIIDFGTAITFDIVSKKGEYMGGLIAPGLKLMQESLHKKTALLPYVELSRPMEIVGQDTVSSIRSGIVYGVASLCEGIINRLLAKDCKGYKVISTGGDACLIKPYTDKLGVVEEFLILKGLCLMAKSQRDRTRSK
ncbi:MAG TPA: type III pantothenate kinase, partial [Candidatus Omnitrophota bacterium]|nr:type III pantothenate kinase [Candidatus Omnitrophota bacterium]